MSGLLARRRAEGDLGMSFLTCLRRLERLMPLATFPFTHPEVGHEHPEQTVRQRTQNAAQLSAEPSCPSCSGRFWSGSSSRVAVATKRRSDAMPLECNIPGAHLDPPKRPDEAVLVYDYEAEEWRPAPGHPLSWWAVRLADAYHDQQRGYDKTGEGGHGDLLDKPAARIADLSNALRRAWEEFTREKPLDNGARIG